MPLRPGKSKEIIAANIQQLIRDGYEPARAAAIAYKKAGIEQPKKKRKGKRR